MPQIGHAFMNEMARVAVSFDGVGMVLKASGATLLEGISGSFPAASLVALMGPSGSGKTTFMNALLGRAPYAHVHGQIVVNGREGGLSHLPSVVGFVPQEDIVHANLTVYENLYYHAMLRLPRSASREARHNHIGQVAKVLGLDHLLSNRVGDASCRGISGGQKKRVNIGMELVAMPAIVFMDEPTSGLDGAQPCSSCVAWLNCVLQV